MERTQKKTGLISVQDADGCALASAHRIPDPVLCTFAFSMDPLIHPINFLAPSDHET